MRLLVEDARIVWAPAKIRWDRACSVICCGEQIPLSYLLYPYLTFCSIVVKLGY